MERTIMSENSLRMLCKADFFSFFFFMIEVRWLFYEGKIIAQCDILCAMQTNDPIHDK